MATIDVNDVVQLTHTAAQVDADIDGSVRADIGQSFSEAQKAQARENIGAKISNRNLLDNPFFTINQRGQTSYTSAASAYTFDRWYMVENSNAGGVKVEKTTGIRFTKLTASGGAGGRIAQRIEDATWQALRGKQITFSITYKSTVTFLLGYGTTYGGAYTTTISCAPSDDWVTVSGTRTIGAASTDYWFSLAVANAQPEGTIDIKAIKLEEGPISTLDGDTAPDYAAELLKCQRFYVRLKNIGGAYGMFGMGVANTATECRVIIPMPIALNKMPTSVTKSGAVHLWATSGATVSNVALLNGGSSSNMLAVSCAASGLTAGGAYILRAANDTNAYIEVNADLL